jgi:hypothetical protein
VPEASGAEVEDQARISRAYNNNIYMMVSVPYVLLGAVGYMVYRQVRARAAAQQAFLDSAHSPSSGPDLSPRPPGDSSCSPPPGAAS